MTTEGGTLGFGSVPNGRHHQAKVESVTSWNQPNEWVGGGGTAVWPPAFKLQADMHRSLGDCYGKAPNIAPQCTPQGLFKRSSTASCLPAVSTALSVSPILGYGWSAALPGGRCWPSGWPPAQRWGTPSHCWGPAQPRRPAPVARRHSPMASQPANLNHALFTSK